MKGLSHSKEKNTIHAYVLLKNDHIWNDIVPLKGHNVPGKLTTIANSIAQHISNVTFDKLVPTRMILNLKIDANEKVWLLWCSSLRTEDSIQENLVVSVPTKS